MPACYGNLAKEKPPMSKRRCAPILLSALLLILAVFPPARALPPGKFEMWKQPGYYRGFNISDWDNLDDRMATQGDFDTLKAAGANLAVIQTQGTLSDSFPYAQHVYYAEGADTVFWQDILDTLVTYARQAAIPYVIAVRTGPGRLDVADEGVSSIWTNRAEQELYGAMLKEMTGRYLPDPLFVGLDLTVEPDPLNELAGEPVAVLDSALAANGIDVNAIYTTWIDSVRTVDTELPLMVEGVHWSNPVYFSLVSAQADPAIVYKVHCYNPYDYSHATPALSETYPGTFWSNGAQEMVRFDQDYLSRTEYASVRSFQQAHDVPVLIGEFGLRYPQNGGEQYLDDIADIACGYGWHFAFWNWNNTAECNYRHFDDIYGTHYMERIGAALTDPCVTGIGEFPPQPAASRAPAAIHLHPNAPNPFNPSTTIAFDVPEKNDIGGGFRLAVFDLRGRLVRTLVSSAPAPGTHRIVWNGRSDRGEPVPSGIYLCSLRWGGERVIRKMVVRK